MALGGKGAIPGNLGRLNGFVVFYFHTSIKVSAPILIIAYIVLLATHEGSTLADFATAYFCAPLLYNYVYKD